MRRLLLLALFASCILAVISSFAVERPPFGSQAQLRYEAAKAATTLAQRQAVLVEFTQATDNSTRSALIAAASESAADYVAVALTAPNPVALSPFVAAILPAVTLDRAPSLVQACANAPLIAAPLKAAVLRGLAQLTGAPAYLDAPTSRLLQRLLTNPDTAAAAIPLVAKWDRTGALIKGAEPIVRQLQRDLLDRAQTDARRGEIGASLLSLPSSRAEALRSIAELLLDPVVSPALRAALTTALADAPGPDVDAVLVSSLIPTKSPAIFEAILKRPEASLALLAALKAKKISPVDVGPANLARLRTHPTRKVAIEAASILDGLARPLSEITPP